MRYDFETLFPPKGHSFWNAIAQRGISDPDVISYGVAEMKFPLCPEIKKALHDCADAGYFGYFGDTEYSARVCDFYARRHNWTAKSEWVIQTYGVVLAFSMAIRAFTEEGDGVIIQSPVYNPFFNEIRANGREVIDNALVRSGSRYEIDFEDLERKVADPKAKMMILCSPHNPVGRVWSKEELSRISEICLRNGVLVVSDEIHNDLVYAGEHHVFASISPEAEQNCVICTAPSKSFNIPGLVTSNVFVPNDKLRERFKAEVSRCIGHFLNISGVAAASAAYEKGCQWLDELIEYLRGNAETFYALVAEKLPKAWTPKMEGTYLAWLDLSFLGMEDSELEKFLIEKAGLFINMGNMYGEGGKGFIRINIGCPRRYITEAVERLAKAINELNTKD